MGGRGAQTDSPSWLATAVGEALGVQASGPCLLGVVAEVGRQAHLFLQDNLFIAPVSRCYFSSNWRSVTFSSRALQ